MIFMLRGTSCSGKSSFIEKYFGDNPSAIFSSDHFRRMLTGDVTQQTINSKVFELIHYIIDYRLVNRVEYTVYDATNLRIKDAQSILDLAKKHQTPVTIISIEPPSVEELKLRNIKRNKEINFLIPEHVFDSHHARYYNCMESFHKEAIYNRLVTFVEIDQNHEVVNEIS